MRPFIGGDVLAVNEQLIYLEKREYQGWCIGNPGQNEHI
jgi:hypothetical protein